MPLTLAIDCAMRRINLGLGENAAFLGCESLNSGAKQGDILPVVVDEFVSRLGHRLPDIDRIAVTVGPGYYTGIRVGLSYATALAESLGARVLPWRTVFSGLPCWSFPSSKRERAPSTLPPIAPGSRY